jgi:hypothetical protein
MINRKDRIAPVALMFIAAGLSFLVCEEVSKRNSPTAQLLDQPGTAQVAQVEAPQQPRNFAQKIAQKINHVVHSSAHSAELMESPSQREDGLKTVQPETASADELGDDAFAHGPLDLSLVPGVIVLPKMQEPLASAGLYDKRTHQKL